MEQVVIIGGGIGGLTAAVAMQRRGLEARVYEAASALGAAGAGIWVPPNAMQVLERLGLADEVRRGGAPIERAVLRDFRAGELQVAALGQDRRIPGWPTVAIHRARLHAVLAAAVESGTLVTGKACVAVRRDGKRVRVAFADGEEVDAGVVVGADGLRSVVREAVRPGMPLRYSGQTSYRAVIDHVLTADFDATGWEVWGPRRRFGFSAIGEGEVYWYATVDAPAGGRDAPGTVRSGLEALFAEFPAPIPTLLGATAEERILRTDIYDFRPMRKWHAGSIVLLGDAAHATTPNLGQGGAQAAEDAYVLAAELDSEGTRESAFERYQRIRMPKAHQVVNRSWTLGRVAHLSNPFARALRNLLLRNAPPSLSRKQLESLNTFDY